MAGLTAVTGPAQQPAPEASGTPWGYNGRIGPDRWARLDPAWRVCDTGKQQSPIDIHGARLKNTLPPIEFHYLSGSMTLTNNGHTVEVTAPRGSYILVGGVRYNLIQFHFHHPGEEAVNGDLPDMSLHLVHQSADGKIVVIAVRLMEGNPNAVLAGLWEHLPKTPGKSATMNDPLSSAGLLPADRGYWTYMGSLTTPPCTEGVRWYVMEQSVTLSRDQLQAFGALYKRNSRQLQEAHGRHIQANE
uniref:carbonic anhydrase n=1 Tax=mine drainage metagenome TaxID=410659 RepID=E6QKU4_9ZZZZ